GNLEDFDPKTDSVAYEELLELDKWALLKLHQLIDKVTQAYDSYDFHLLFHAIHNFCAVEMSAFYLDVVKDRLYVEAPASTTRRAVQTVIYQALQALVRLMAPVLAHTAEEVWQHLPESCREVESIHMASWPQVEERYLDQGLEQRFRSMLKLRDEIARALERARAQKLIGSSLEAAVEIYGPESALAQIARDFPPNYMMDLAIVSKLDWKIGEAPEAGDLIMEAESLDDVTVVVNRAPGYKCERCWKYTPQQELCQRCQKVLEAL
ncbi:MAG TPA: class I tRNA ligase family protein, partial [Bacillota bacterium]|nr:class I tRNA ligase family protein [Bacillota bacterium]